MHPPVDIQLWRLAVLFLLGIFCSTLFQAYTALRRATSPRKFTAHVLDGVVAVLVLTVIAIVVFVVNYGEVRLYIVIALALGFALCNALVGNLVYDITFACTKAVMRTVSKVKHALKSAIRAINQKLWTPLINRLKKPSPPDDGSDG